MRAEVKRASNSALPGIQSDGKRDPKTGSEFVRLLLCVTTAAIGLAAGQAAAETYPVRAVEIDHAAATLTVISEDRSNIDVSVTAGSSRVAAPSVRLEGDHVLIDGGLERRIRGCGTTMGVRTARINGA